MVKPKRYHPLNILFDLWGFIKNTFFIVLVLFVFNRNSDSFIMHYGRIVFFFAFGFSIFTMIYHWFVSKYALQNETFYLYRGLFKKSERRIPFSKVHNIKRHRSFLHRLLRITSITFETSMSGSDAAVTFKAVSFAEVERIEDIMTADAVVEAETSPKRVVHFTPTRKDTIKAAFTSFSFLLLVPIVMSIYLRLDDLFDLDEKAEGMMSTMLHSWWFIALVIGVLILASLAFGLVRAFIIYGKYEISSDDERVYITRGVIDETAFTIAKERVQAVEITQSFMKRLLGLAEVKLISAGSLGDNDHEASSLYPFLPVEKAYQMIGDLLPTYQVNREMNRLPRRSLWVRLIRISWIWVIATALLIYFKPPVFDIEQSWWMISLVLLVLVIVSRLLDFFNSRFTIHEQFIQFKSGSLGTTLFITKREKIVQINVSRSKLQQLLGLASLNMVNRAKPVHHSYMIDVPNRVANSFYTWYAGRINEVEVEQAECLEVARRNGNTF